jgi:hypothetical protein
MVPLCNSITRKNNGDLNDTMALAQYWPFFFDPRVGELDYKVHRSFSEGGLNLAHKK